MSAETTTTLASASSSRSFSSTSSPYMPLHHQIEQHDVGLIEEVALERAEAVLGFGDFESGGLEDLPQRPARQRRVVDDQHSGLHMRSTIAAVSRSSGTLSSLSPASTTDRGMP